MSQYGDRAKVKINPQSISAITSKILQKKIRQLESEFKITLESPLFEWNSVTKRKNGEIVGPGLRNAVDTGRLKNSSIVQFYKSGTGTIVWRVPYSGLIFDRTKTDLVLFTLARMRNK